MAKILWAILLLSIVFVAVEANKKREMKKDHERLKLHAMKAAVKRAMSGHLFSKTRFGSGQNANLHQVLDFLKHLQFSEGSQAHKMNGKHGHHLNKKFLRRLKEAFPNNEDETERFFKNLKRKFKKFQRKNAHLNNNKRHLHKRKNNHPKSKLTVIHADNEVQQKRNRFPKSKSMIQ